MPHCQLYLHRQERQASGWKKTRKKRIVSEVYNGLICIGSRCVREKIGGAFSSLFCSNMVNFKTAEIIKKNSSSDPNIFAVEPRYGTFSWAKSVHASLDTEVR